MQSLVLGAFLGLLGGLASFATLRLNLRLWLAGGGVGRFALWQAIRLGLTGALFWGAASLGAGPLIAALGGFLLARTLAVPRLR